MDTNAENASQVDPVRPVSYSIEPNGSLLLQPLLKDHQGEWECSISNRAASIETRTRVFVLAFLFFAVVHHDYMSSFLFFSFTKISSLRLDQPVSGALASFHQLLSSPLRSRCRNQSPRRRRAVRLSWAEPGQPILGGRLRRRSSADVFSLVGVKPPAFLWGRNHGSHRQPWYCSIDLRDEEFIYLPSPLGGVE
ncbi:hypothetical protein CCH79_00000690 [Gambusia affinis]|uniref:Ig-like domain-containing protein n=1 Tax=Gambusia affinis TaxID=33528 RepID=A0A315VTY5_GAMAF|nr:hypothetical protein CCH79_00000690 [Gambusia affinis]